MLKLSDKIAIITGACSGIGKSITSYFLSEGCKVVAVDKNEKRINGLMEEMKHSKDLTPLIADIMDDGDIEKIFITVIRQYGSVDILVNNAGIMDDFAPIADLDDEIWNKVMRVNAEAPMKTMRRALKIFLPKNSGNIINIASVGGLYGARAGAAYTASKHALIGLTKNTGFVYAKSGIRCNAIAPGAVNTNISETIDNTRITPFIQDRIMTGMVLNPRVAEPAEIAKCAVFLASDDSSFVNGEILVADGGWTAY